jgi:hypothetical protein
MTIYDKNAREEQEIEVQMENEVEEMKNETSDETQA